MAYKIVFNIANSHSDCFDTNMPWLGAEFA